MPENNDFFKVFMKVQNQHIMGFGGPVDLNFESVRFIMDIYDIPNRREVYEKVHRLYQITVAAMREKLEIEKDANS